MKTEEVREIMRNVRNFGVSLNTWNLSWDAFPTTETLVEHSGADKLEYGLDVIKKYWQACMARRSNSYWNVSSFCRKCGEEDYETACQCLRGIEADLLGGASKND